MQHLLNTLYVLTPGSYLSREDEAVAVRLEKTTRAKVPLASLESILCFGGVAYSGSLLGICAEQGISLTHLTGSGRFLAEMRGPVRGNVLLRRTQYRWADDAARAAAVTCDILTGKLMNARGLLRRGARDATAAADRDQLAQAADALGRVLPKLLPDLTVDSLRGLEGEAGRLYWGAFPALLRSGDKAMQFAGRVRRPPTDPVNALLSFLYTLLAHDLRGALEGVGLDPYVGFLHQDRPGRVGLALDLMEELRAVLVDRLVISLVNLRQVSGKGFVRRETGAMEMTDTTRQTVLTAWQDRKKQTLTHPFLGEAVPVGLIPHVQAQLLARHLRGDLDRYPALIWPQ